MAAARVNKMPILALAIILFGIGMALYTHKEGFDSATNTSSGPDSPTNTSSSGPKSATNTSFPGGSKSATNTSFPGGTNSATNNTSSGGTNSATNTPPKINKFPTGGWRSPNWENWGKKPNKRTKWFSK